MLIGSYRYEPSVLEIATSLTLLAMTYFWGSLCTHFAFFILHLRISATDINLRTGTKEPGNSCSPAGTLSGKAVLFCVLLILCLKFCILNPGAAQRLVGIHIMIMQVKDTACQIRAMVTDAFQTGQ